MKIKNCGFCVDARQIERRDDVVVCMSDMKLHNTQEENDCFYADKCETCIHSYTYQGDVMDCSRMDAGLSCMYEERGRESVAIKNAKTIAEYAIRKYLQEQGFDTEYCTLEMNGHECTLTDQNGDSMVFVYDPDEKSVYIKEF